MRFFEEKASHQDTKEVGLVRLVVTRISIYLVERFMVGGLMALVDGGPGGGAATMNPWIGGWTFARWSCREVKEGELVGGGGLVDVDQPADEGPHCQLTGGSFAAASH